MTFTKCPFQQLSDAQAADLEQSLRSFDRAWQRGERPTIDDYLPPTEHQRLAALIELVHIELEYRLGAGEPVSVGDYLQRYPELSGDQEAVDDLLAAEEGLDKGECRRPAVGRQPTDGPPWKGLSDLASAAAERHKSHLQPADGKLQPGTRIGRFELVEQVGVGSFGTVYKAHDLELHRIVALKTPHSGSSVTPEEKHRFLREARSASRLRHTGIVSVHDVGEDKGSIYLVSDFIDGKTLAERLSAWRPDFRPAAELVAQVADALDCAHQQGVIHRDVKPSNILIGPDGRPHLTDFGLAKQDAVQTMLTCEGQVLGTPAYMSPEQARGDANRVDCRTDVYSLGVVFYELLTGTLPFRGPAHIVLLQFLEDEPSPPRRLNDRIPRDLDTICLKCLEKEPDRRYASAQAVAEDLRHFLAGEPITARPISASRRAVKWARRRPTVAALLGLSLVLVITLMTAGALLRWSSSDE